MDRYANSEIFFVVGVGFVCLWAANIYGYPEFVIDVLGAANNFEVDCFEEAGVYKGILKPISENSVDIHKVVSYGFMFI